MKSPNSKFSVSSLAASAQSQLQRMLADIPRQIIDQNSVTCSEMSEHLNVSKEYIRKKIIVPNLKSGKWEKVFKKIDGVSKPCESYRIKK